MQPCLQVTLEGGMSLDVYVPSLPDDTSSLHLVFSADTADTAPNTTSTSDTADTLSVDMVDLIRDGLRPNIYHATVPPCTTPGQRRLVLRCTDNSGHHSVLYTAQFTYTPHNHQELAEQLLQRVKKGLTLHSDLIPSLGSSEDVAELDRALTEAMQGADQPLEWRALLDGGGREEGGGRERAPQSTLLHLASRHNLESLAKHLVTLPQVDLALCLPDEQGFTPLDIARDVGNLEILKLLTCALLQSNVSRGDLSSTGGLGSALSRKRNWQDELLRFREINEAWRGQIRRHKTSSSSMGSTNYTSEMSSVNSRDRLPTPPFPQISPSTAPSLPDQRRKSIAVMEQRHATVSQCLQINVKDPELAVMERRRKQSWSVVVGDADSRSVDTGLNELDRVIAADGVQQCRNAMKGDLEASQEKEERRGSSLDPAHLNLLYCYSVSCPLLVEDEDSGTGTNSLLTSTRTSPGPDVGYDTSDSPPLHLHPPSIPTSISVPDNLSETEIHTHGGARHSSPHPPAVAPGSNPCPALSIRVPQVITTRYSTEDLKIVSHARDGPTYNNGVDDGWDHGGHTKGKGKNNVQSESHSTVKEHREEEEEEGEGQDRGLCQSASAPHLRGESENGTEHEREEEDERGEKRCSETRHMAEQEEHERTADGEGQSKVHRKAKREVAFGKESTVQETKHSGEGSSSDNPSVLSPKKKSHRRSQSMSIVELGIPPTDKKYQPEKGDEEEEGTGKVVRRNRGLSMLKPNQPLPVVEGSQSPDHYSNSASQSSSIKDNRSRASSLLTDASSMHESGESSEDDTMPELSGLSCASLEGMDEHDGPSTTTPVVNETEQRLKLPNDSPNGLVVFRGRKERPKDYRYSADVLSTYKEELQSHPELEEVWTRRLNSESVDERKDDAAEQSQEFVSSIDGTVDPEKTRLINDSVFEQEVTLSDVDVRMASDENLSQDKSTPHLSPTYKGSKRWIYRSPRLGRKAHTVKEKTTSSPKKKLMRGLTKEDVSPLIGKIRSVLSSHEVSDEDEATNASAAALEQAHNSSPHYPATSPGGGSTNLDRLPRSPLSTSSDRTPTSATPPSKYHPSPLSYQQQQQTSKPTTSPPLSPPSPGHERRSTSPSSFVFDQSKNDKKQIPKSKSDKNVSGGKRKKKLKSMSLDGSSEAMKDIMSIKNRIAETVQEENTEEEEELDLKSEVAGKKDGKKGKGMMRDNIFRRSKSRMKAMTILGGGTGVEKAINESFTKGSGAIRAKSAKQRPKLDNIFSSQNQTEQQMEHQTSEEGSEETTTTKEKGKRSTEQRRGSDSSIVVSPTNPTLDHSLSVVSELPKAPPTSEPTDPNSLSPAPVENLSDSDREEVPPQLVRSMSESHPELEIKEDRNWERTMDRRVLRKMNKHERDRQNIIHELIQTEHHHYRSLHVLKLVFKEQMTSYVSEDALEVMFPELDNLIEISKSFLDRLEERSKEGASGIIHDISDILLEEFTGSRRERVLNTFGEFCTYHLIAAEMYKEHLKKKQFGRLVQQLYRVKECQRLYLPDYYTSVSQRLTKMVQFLARLVKKTDLLKLDHTDRLRRCQEELVTLVAAVDKHVDDRKNHLELQAIQDKLDINLPRSSAKDYSLRLAMKDLNLTAQSRRLIKRGDAQLIHGHGKQLPVHIVLVTDLVVLLTERDQKYNLPALLDLKPPIIRLYDLHVRVNASVRSGVQLLLLEKGRFPEMFRLDFKSKKEAKAWEVTLTNAVDVCKDRGLTCEYFGSEPVVIEEEKTGERESGRNSAASTGVKRSESQRSTSSSVVASVHDVVVRRIQSARSALDAANRTLSMFVTSSTSTADLNASPRHPPTAAVGNNYRFNQSPKNRHNTIHQVSSRVCDGGNSVVPDREGMLASTEMDGGGSKKTQKSKIKRNRLDRSSTFRGRGEDKKEKEKEKERGGGGGGGGGVSESVDSAAHQQLLVCAMRMRDSLEDILRDFEEKDAEIERLRRELVEARQSAVAAAPPTIVVARKPSPHSSPLQFRPHSCHVADLSGSLSQPSMGEDTVGLVPLPSDTGT